MKPALLRVVNEMLCHVDRGNKSTLILLELSVALDTLERVIPLNRLSTDMMIRGVT